MPIVEARPNYSFPSVSLPLGHITNPRMPLTVTKPRGAPHPGIHQPPMVVATMITGGQTQGVVDAARCCRDIHAFRWPSCLLCKFNGDSAGCFDPSRRPGPPGYSGALIGTRGGPVTVPPSGPPGFIAEPGHYMDCPICGDSSEDIGLGDYRCVGEEHKFKAGRCQSCEEIHVSYRGRSWCINSNCPTRRK